MAGSELERTRTRRQLLKGAGALAALGGAGAGALVALSGSVSGSHPARGLADGGASPHAGGGAAVSLEELAANVVSGGPGKDGIPAIDRPRFLPAADARFLRDEDVVFGIVYRGQVRAYPQLILVWHEIVNDVFAGRRASVTYCPLTGSVVAFEGRALNGRPLTFGTTGNLVNSNLLMYDRVTNSDWPQLFGTAILGPQTGTTLTEVPLVWTTWGRWRTVHPDTVVLSTNTGYVRNYGSDPYGSYTPLGGYYASGGPFFAVIAHSARLPAKEVVVGVKAGERRVAIRKRALQRARVLELQAGPKPLLAVWDDRLSTGRVFVREARGRRLAFKPGELRDTTGSAWNQTGSAVSGPLTGTQLPPADFLDAMWFGWYAFYPNTTLIA